MENKRVFKSVQKVAMGGSTTFRPWGQWKEGELFIGKYVSTKPDNYGNPSFLFEGVEASFDKEIEGKKVVLNAAGMLNKAMETVNPGQYVQVVYTGKSRIEKGPYKGKDSHAMEVDIMQEESDDSDLI